MAHTNLLRCLAALMIANSHLEGFYPDRRLAADGLLGDALFFILSGYGLSKSLERSPRGFLAWYGRRLGRIAPAVVLIGVVFDVVLTGRWRAWGAADWLGGMARWMTFGFVGQILLYYAAFYPIARFGGSRLLGGLAVGLLAPYALIPALGRHDAVFHATHALYYFQLMLFGGWLGGRGEGALPAGKGPMLLFAAIGLLYAGSRVVLGSGRWFFVPMLLIAPLAVGLLQGSRSAFVGRVLASSRPLSWLVGAVAGSTLEIYLIHYRVIDDGRVAALGFPGNIAAFFAVTLVLSTFAAKVAGLVSRSHALAWDWRLRRFASPT